MEVTVGSGIGYWVLGIRAPQSQGLGESVGEYPSMGLDSRSERRVQRSAFRGPNIGDLSPDNLVFCRSIATPASMSNISI